MRHSPLLLVPAALLLFGIVLNGQYRREDWYRHYGREPLDRVRADLSRAARDMHYLSGGEMRRFDRVRDGIADFQRNWERGRYDRGALDRSIDGLRSVVERNRLRPRDRDILADDLERLRDLRARYDRGFR